MLKVPLQTRYSKSAKEFIAKALYSVDPDQRFYWFSTSGTTLKPGQSKWVALSQEALCTSCDAVNTHLEIDGADIYGNPLPLFHVGGYMLQERAKRAGIACFLFQRRWDPYLFCAFLREKKVTVTSVVPTQVYDLVQRSLSPAQYLRAVVVGGGHLEHTLYAEAIKLGWPLLRSYGMTELSSQVATARLGSVYTNALAPLPHIEWKQVEGRWHVRSKSLFSQKMILSFEEKKIISREEADEWFALPDLIEKSEEGITVLGRSDGVVKILGELVNVMKVEATIEGRQREIAPFARAVVLPCACQRTGMELHLHTELAQELWPLLREKLSSALLPFEVPAKWVYKEKIPLTPLGKPKKTLKSR